jgi:large subunit ribosomal protein LP2
MRFIAAYLLASLGGNQSPTKDDVRAILGSVGANVDEDKLEMLFKEVEGKDLAELLAAGREKLAFASAGAAAMDASPAAAAGAAEEKKEKVEEKEEEEDEEDLDMFSLFD